MAKRKKVLLITSYWPPAGGAGVQRWLKMCKYLQRDFDLTVYHPKDASYPIEDKTLLAEVPEDVQLISAPIWEPYKLAEIFNPQNKAFKKGQIEKRENQSFLSKVSLWVRANWFVPDARKYWVKPSVKYLKEFLEQNPQDVIITTGPPHSVHLIGHDLKEHFPQLKWLADFRDPWTEIDYFDQLPVTSSTLKKHQTQEGQVLQNADTVVTVSPTWAERLSEISQRPVEVVYNGFDAEDFEQKNGANSGFNMRYVGSLNKDRNVSLLWETLDEILQENEQFKKSFHLYLTGNISTQIQKEILSHTALSEHVTFESYVSHQEAVRRLQSSQVLLLLINDTPNQKGIIPGKLFEYMASGRRVFCLGKEDSDIQEILQKTKVGVVIDRGDKENMKTVLRNWMHTYHKGLWKESQGENIYPYSRKNAAIQIGQLIENI